MRACTWAGRRRPGGSRGWEPVRWEQGLAEPLGPHSGLTQGHTQAHMPTPHVCRRTPHTDPPPHSRAQGLSSDPHGQP